MTIFREEATSALAVFFSCGSSILVKLEFEDVGVCGGGKTVEPGEKPSEQSENQQQTQHTQGRNQAWATLIGTRPIQ